MSQLLKEQNIFPSKEVLKDVLGNVYNVFEEMITRLTQDEFSLTVTWNYYKDGKSWLCKVCDKKKTILWLSVWEGFFKISFYFTEKHLESIASLDISEQIKEVFFHTKPAGKLIPLIININTREQLTDLLKIAKYKKDLTK
ncbi:DUF3788 family protein [Dysgonomonas termitidis]|uniref:DUF3788 family protein n=1 Tax=Dysgonomonas termitidis TaxID=1516126 RepID=A0ABV9L3W4_9BACT|nr:hypothetical protein FACS1894169_14440 [Bacteroidia bacterium]